MTQQLPEGWSQERIQAIIDHYENQTEDEAIAEDEGAYNDPDSAMVQVPHAIMPEVMRLIAEYENKNEKKMKQARRR